MTDDSCSHRTGEVWPEMEEDGWQLDPLEVTISKTSAGEDIMIGQGGFGSVRLLLTFTPALLGSGLAHLLRIPDKSLLHVRLLSAVHYSDSDVACNCYSVADGSAVSGSTSRALVQLSNPSRGPETGPRWPCRSSSESCTARRRSQ